MTNPDIHEDILLDICLNLCNCADCYDEYYHTCNCHAKRKLDISHVTETSFCIEPYEEKTNLRLKKVAAINGYNMKEVKDPIGNEYLKFSKVNLSIA